MSSHHQIAALQDRVNGLEQIVQELRQDGRAYRKSDCPEIDVPESAACSTEERLALLEREVRELKRDLLISKGSLQVMDGIMRGVEGFEEMVRLGRAIRDSDREAPKN